MKKVLRKIPALVVFVLFFAASFSPASADVVAPNCSYMTITPRTVDANTTNIHVHFDGVNGLGDDTSFVFYYTAQNTGSNPVSRAGEVDWDIPFSLSQITSAPQSIYMEASGLSGAQQYCESSIVYDPETGTGIIGTPGLGVPPTSFNLCQQAGSDRNACDQCLQNSQIWTGVGCIPFSTQTGTVTAFITLGLGLTGATVVLLSLYASFLLSTSQGDPKRVDEAKTAITSAIVGAFFIIFSVTILRFIGVNLLQLPSFG